MKASAATTSSRANPNLDGQYPTRDLTIYRGDDSQGQPQYTTPLLPQRAAAGMVNALATGNPDEMLYEGSNVLRGHATPAIWMIADALASNSAQAKDPAVPANFDTVYDKDAPTGTKWSQIAKYLVGHGIPLPLVQFSVQDALRQGMTPDQFKMALQQSAGMGFDHTRAGLQEKARAVPSTRIL